MKELIKIQAKTDCVTGPGLFAIHSASLLTVLIKIQAKTDCVTGPGLIAIVSVSLRLERQLLYLQQEQVA